MKLPLEQFSCQATAYYRENCDVRYRCSLFCSDADQYNKNLLSILYFPSEYPSADLSGIHALVIPAL
jgi:hypothetical protein